MTQNRGIIVAGMGALGKALAVAIHEKPGLLSGVVTSSSRQASFFKNTGVAVYNSIESIRPRRENILFLTFPDDQIAETARKCSLTENAGWKGTLVVHCSGSLTSDALNPLKQKGADTASFHPLQTFRKGDGPERFERIYFTVEGNNASILKLQKLAKELGATAVAISKEQKQKLHLAAVFASNYMVAILDAAERTAKSEEIPKPLEMLRPLMEQTLQNVLNNGPAGSLSGPVFRGDSETVKRHLGLPGVSENVRQFYRSAGLYMLSMLEYPDSGKSEWNQIKKILKNEP